MDECEHCGYLEGFGICYDCCYKDGQRDALNGYYAKPTEDLDEANAYYEGYGDEKVLQIEIESLEKMITAAEARKPL